MNTSTEGIRRDLREFIENDLLFGQGDVRDDASFLEEGIIDSTGVLELVGFLERRYGIKVEDAELVPENLDSLNGIIAFLQRKLALESVRPNSGRS